MNGGVISGVFALLLLSGCGIQSISATGAAIRSDWNAVPRRFLVASDVGETTLSGSRHFNDALKEKLKRCNVAADVLPIQQQVDRWAHSIHWDPANVPKALAEAKVHEAQAILWIRLNRATTYGIYGPRAFQQTYDLLVTAVGTGTIVWKGAANVKNPATTLGTDPLMYLMQSMSNYRSDTELEQELAGDIVQRLADSNIIKTCPGQSLTNRS